MKYFLTLVLCSILFSQDTIRVPKAVLQQSIQSVEQDIIKKKEELDELKGQLRVLYTLRDYKAPIDTTKKENINEPK